MYLPKDDPTIEEYLKEWSEFPAGKHDDEVDATSQALSKMLYAYGATGREGGVRNVLENALRTADIIIVTDSDRELPIDGDINRILKRNVLIFDLSKVPGKAFPTIQRVDLGELDRTTCKEATGFCFANDLNSEERARRRRCFVNPGSTVPRTAAMALSDTFITLLSQIADCESAGAALPMTPGLQEATLTFMGKAVNEHVARLASMRYTDIRILLSLS